MVSKSNNLIINQLFSGFDFQKTIDLIPGSVFIKDKEGVILAANSRLKKDAKVDPVGKTDFDLPWKEQAEMCIENDKKVMSSKQQMVFVEKVHLSEGTKTFISVKAPLFDDNGAVIGIIGHATEATGV